MSNVVEIPLQPLQIVGIIESTMIHIATYNLVDASKRNEVVQEILTYLSSESVCFFGDTVIKTERYDGFRVI